MNKQIIEDIAKSLTISLRAAAVKINFMDDESGEELFCFYAQDIIHAPTSMIENQVTHLGNLLTDPDQPWVLDNEARLDVYNVVLNYRRS